MKARTWLLSSVATVAFAFNAAAADMGAPYKAPVAYAAPFSWTGFYLGASAGGIGISSENTYTNNAVGDVICCGNTDTNRGTGVLAGGTIGYNYQGWGPWVIGIEADYSMASAQTGTSPSFNFGGGNGIASISNLGTVRGRLGWASDHTLLFITGGVAWGDVTNVAAAPIAGAGCRQGFSGTLTGWTFGGGVEHALTDHFTVKLEALYVDFGTRSTSSSRCGCAFGFNAKTTAAIGRLGLNYKF
jgi:outer membrane immunogenic protein